MNILIIDDHPIFLDGLAQALQTLDANIITTLAFTVVQALSELDKDSNYDLILVDLN